MEEQKKAYTEPSLRLSLFFKFSSANHSIHARLCPFDRFHRRNNESSRFYFCLCRLRTKVGLKYIKRFVFEVLAKKVTFTLQRRRSWTNLHPSLTRHAHRCGMLEPEDSAPSVVFALDDCYTEPPVVDHGCSIGVHVPRLHIAAFIHCANSNAGCFQKVLHRYAKCPKTPATVIEG